MQRRRYSRDQWRAWLFEQAGSDVSVVEFCRRKGVSAKTFYLWQRKLADEPAGQETVDHPLVPVSLVGGAQVEIDLPCGATIRLPSDESAARLILSVLMELGSRPSDLS